MRVGLVVSSNKYTGAAAVAEGWCRALHAAGVDARLLFVGGANLERRLVGLTWAEPGLVKERRIADIRRNLRALRKLSDTSDVVICHLPHDHFEAIAAGVHRRVRLVRAFRRPRHLRRDAFHRALARRIVGAIAPYDAVIPDIEELTRAPVAVVPASVDERFCIANGDKREARRALSIESDRPILGMVGKLAKGRGFELLLDAASLTRCEYRVLVIGHGELQQELEHRAAALGLEDRITWTGKREEDLPDLYRAMDAVLFSAPGSDWGHRAITEAQASGRPVIAVDWPGVGDLVEDNRTGIVVSRDPEAVAAAMDRIVYEPDGAGRIGAAAAAAVVGRRLPPIGVRLTAFLESCR